MKKSIFWIIVSILALATVAGFGLYYIQTNQTKIIAAELSSLSAQSTKTALDLTNSNNSLLSDNEKIQKDLDQKRGDYNKVVDDLAEMASKYSELQTQINCNIDRNYTFNMSTQSTVSESLKTLVGDTTGKVITANWDIIWSNAKTTIHKLNTEEYLLEFIVDLNDEKLNKKNSIYWIDSQCFINESQLK